MEYIKYIIIFILLYNFENIISALANLIIESMNWVIGIIALDLSKRQHKAELETMNAMRAILARAICKDITRSEIHDMVEQIYDEYMGDND